MLRSAKSTPQPVGCDHASGGTNLTRRAFLAALGKGALMAAGYPLVATDSSEMAQSLSPVSKASATASVVHKVYSKRVLRGLKVHPTRLAALVDQTIMAVSGKNSLPEAWARYIKHDWRVLLKFTSFVGNDTGSQRDMVNAICGSLERADMDLSRFCIIADYTPVGHPLLIEPAIGWSQKSVKVVSRKQQIRKYLEGVDAIVNIPSLTDHVQYGVSCAMLNVSTAFIRRPGIYTGDDIHHAIAELCDSSRFNGDIAPVVLTLVDALWCAYSGGPMALGAYLVPVKQMWASTDMVAIDTLARQWINMNRKREKLKSLVEENRDAEFIDIAAKAGLGKSSLDAIKLEQISI